MTLVNSALAATSAASDNSPGPASDGPTATATTQVVAAEVTARAADLRAFIEACCPSRNKGKLFTPIGRGPHWHAAGQYAHMKFFGNVALDYSHDHPDVIESKIVGLIAESKDADVYICPNLMYKDRTPGSCVGCWVIHADWDGSEADLLVVSEKVTELGGFAVASGSPGHVHAYVPLATLVNAARAKLLCKAFQAALPPGSDKGKHTVNDLLRPPGTRNHKSVAITGEPTPVDFLIRPSGTRVDPDALEMLLGVSAAKADANGPGGTSHAEVNGEAAVLVDLTEYPDVNTALAVPVLKVDGTVDRSATTMKVVAACHRSGLLLAQTRAAVASRADLAGRLDERHDDDVQTCWLRLIDEQQRLVKDTGWTSAPRNPEPCKQPLLPVDSRKRAPARPEGQPKRWKATQLKPVAQARFLAKSRIPRAAVTILCGDEGIGKSLFWVLVVAAVTTGKPVEMLGIPAREPADVILILTEDDWASDVQPRLIVAGADMDRIEVICTDDDGTGSPIFPADMDLIIDADPKPALIVVDAWLDTVPSTLMVRDAQQSRTALHPWKDAATKTGAAVLLLTHSNRLASANMRDRYGATASLRQKARMTLYALADPDDGTLIVGPDKANSTAGQTKASRFRITGEVYFNPNPDHDGTVPSLLHLGSTGKTIKAHLLEIVDSEQRTGRRRTAAEEWLVEFLTKGPRKSVDVYAEGVKAEGEFSRDQLKRAKEKVAQAFRGTGDDECWFWELLPEYVAQQSKGEEGDDDDE